MKFTLIYDGPLLPDRKATKEHKHDIRSNFNDQLALLWLLKPLLGMRKYAMGERTVDLTKKYEHALAGTKPEITDGWLLKRNKHWFLPVVSDQLNASASVNITWFRNEKPGELLQAGDIDNRVKTLCDTLQVPPPGQLVPELDVSNRKTPFLCVLEDDALITELNVKTERLLRPNLQSHHALVIVEIVTRVSEVDLGNLHLI